MCWYKNQKQYSLYGTDGFHVLTMEITAYKWNLCVQKMEYVFHPLKSALTKTI